MHFILAICACFLFGIQHFVVSKKRLNHDLKSLPGPFMAPFSAYYRVLLVFTGHIPTNFRRLHERYGPLVRTGPNHVSVCHEDAVGIIYGEGHTFLKSDLYDVFSPSFEGELIETVLTTKIPSHHRRLAKILANRFSLKAVTSYEPYIDITTSKLIKSIYSMHGQPFDTKAWAQYWATDIGSVISLGKPIGFMDQGRDIKGIVKGLSLGFKYGAIIGQVPGWHYWLIGSERFLQFLHDYTNLEDPIWELLKMSSKALEDWDAKSADPDDGSLLHWVQSQPDLASPPLTRMEKINIVFNDIVAGSSTCSSVLTTVLCFLSLHPSVQRKLNREIVDWEAAGRLSSPSTYNETMKMPYLQAVLKESMRLCPVNPIPLDRVVPPGGAVLCDKFLPEGTRVGVSAAALHHLSSLFGADHADFRPERWLEADVETLKRMQRGYFAFGKGKRGCAGKATAMMQMSKTTVEIMRRFEVAPVPGAPKWRFKAWWLPEHENADLVFRDLKY